MDLTLSFQEYFLRYNKNLITIQDFSEYLSVFQKIIYILAEEQGFEKNDQDFRFLIKKIKLGSLECVIESFSNSKDINEENPVENVINDFKGISELIDKPGQKETFFELKEKVKIPENRISLYNYFDRIIPKENLAFQIFTKEKRISIIVEATFTRLSISRKEIIAIIKSAVINTAITGVLNLRFTLEKKAGRRLSFDMASGFREAAIRPAFAVVMNESMAA
ncbi:hypothetical protein LCGC14_2013500, partial [marine sediment metagenome]